MALQVYQIDTGIYYWMALENGTVDDAVSALMAYQGMIDEEEDPPERWKIKAVSEEGAKKMMIRTDDGSGSRSLFEEFALCTGPTVLACSEW